MLRLGVGKEQMPEITVPTSSERRFSAQLLLYPQPEYSRNGERFSTSSIIQDYVLFIAISCLVVWLLVIAKLSIA